ncbi:MAG: DUF4129 domain-containing protein [Syntrophorhabdaceae bacterium]
MRSHEKLLLYFSGAVMEFSWVYAWGVFALISLQETHLPVLDCIILFAGAACITRLCTGRAFRVITIGLFESLGFIMALVWSLNWGTAPDRGFLDPYGISGLITQSRSAIEVLRLIILALWMAAIWLSGALFSVRTVNREKMSSRFDIGLCAFFCLVLLQFVINVKGGGPVQNGTAISCASIFFFFGLLAIGITRAHGPRPSGLMTARRGLGIILLFIGVVFISVMGLVFFFRESLGRAAGTGYMVMTNAASSLRSVFVNVVRFLYGPRQVRIREAPSGGNDNIIDHISSSDTGPWIETFGRIFAWFFGTFIGIMIVIAGAAGAVLIIRWLFSRNRGDRRQIRAFTMSFGHDMIFSLVAKIRRSLQRKKNAADFYNALLGWAHVSGLPRRKNETANEFSARIGPEFPAIENEIQVIADAFNREYYGDLVLSKEEISMIRSSSRRLKDPRLWPVRVKALLRGRF